jgi:hypothetical protein
MGWIKTKLPTKWHSKLKHYRDDTSCSSLSEAAMSLIQRGIVAYESENGTLPEEYDKPEHPTWDNNNDQ